MRREISFASQGELCYGWLYVPDDLEPGQQAPAIVTANAITAIKEITLPGYAERFAAAGFVTLVFDYRFWGASSGEPRNHFVAYEQQQDIRNAITWLAQQPEVDPDRIGAWGVSMGGAHMIYLAAFDHRLKAVVTTATSVSAVGVYEQLFGREALQGLLANIGQDRVYRYSSGSPATHMQAWGRPGDNCALPEEEAYDFYMRMQRTTVPQYDNRITLQSVENMLEYNPDFAIHLASPTPVLFVHAEYDVIPLSLVREVYDRALEPKRLVVCNCRHTELYDLEPWFTQSSTAAVEWFQEYLQPRTASDSIPSATPPVREESERTLNLPHG